jgi:hypothetical protein
VSVLDSTELALLEEGCTGVAERNWDGYVKIEQNPNDGTLFIRSYNEDGEEEAILAATPLVSEPDSFENKEQLRKLYTIRLEGAEEVRHVHNGAYPTGHHGASRTVTAFLAFLVARLVITAAVLGPAEVGKTYGVGSCESFHLRSWNGLGFDPTFYNPDKRKKKIPP